MDPASPARPILMPRWLHLVLDTVFPSDCDVCARPLPPAHGTSLCVSCVAAMRSPPLPLCSRCGVPVSVRSVHDECPACVRRPPAFHSARAAALYLPATAGLNALAAAVHALKYGRRRRVAAALGSLLAARYPYGPGALLVPVPLHVNRLRTRGFNQAVLLARALAGRRRLEVAARALVRLRDTHMQPGLSAAERRRNLRGAFIVREPATMAGRHVVLVDDVLTTGATADACAAVLRTAGAARVDVFTVGRAP
jgi:ComF family protein